MAEPDYDKMYPTNHLFVLSPTNPLRKACVAITNSNVSIF